MFSLCKSGGKQKFLEKRQGVFMRTGAFIRINTLTALPQTVWTAVTNRLLR